MKSIRQQLLVYLLCSIVGLFVLAGVGLYLVIDHTVYREFNRDLRHEAELLSAQVNTNDHGKLQFDMALLPGRLPGRVLMVFDSDGSPIYRSTKDLPINPATEQSGFTDAVLNGEPFRNFTVKGMANPDEDVPPAERVPKRPFTLVFGRPIEPTQRIANMVAWSFAGTGAVVAVAATALILGIVKSGLRTLQSLTDRLQHMNVNTLNEPVVLAQETAELQPMVDRLNEMMQRLKETFERQARFTSNAAHEFRTPIAEIRSAAEVALMRPWLGEKETQSFQDILLSAQRMQGVISTLLNLARSKGSQLDLRSLSLPQCLESVISSLPAGAASKQIQTHVDCPTGGTIVAMPEAVHGIMANLIQNALEYRADDSPVDIFVSDSPEASTIEITNSAREADIACIGRFGEQFWRNSHSRADSTHSGLGCSLVKMYSSMVGATVAWKATSGPARIVAEVVFRKTAGPPERTAQSTAS